MRRFTSSLLLGLSVLSHVQPSIQQSWALEWRSSDDKTSVANGNEPQSCTPINHTKGLEFSWDSHGGPWCIEFWHDKNCTSRAGWDCNPWPWVQDSSQDLNGFSVYRNETAATSSASPTTATATSSSAASASSGAATTTGAGSGNDDDGGLSGGEIAGVVVGVVAGVAIIAALAFFFGLRRRRQNKAVANANANAHDYNDAPPSSSVPAGNIEMEKPIPWAQSPVKEEQPYRYAPGSRLVELAGENAAAELSDHTRVVELESPATDVKTTAQP